MNDIILVEVVAQRVAGIKITGTYKLIPDLLMKFHEYTVKKMMIISGPAIYICHEISPQAVIEERERDCLNRNCLASFRNGQGHTRD